MQSTKENIISVSQQLFYEFGIANTRLQQIADAAEISIGNLAYHYKNKDAIVEAVYNNLFTELTA
ncbi:TetR/AcrR family transcriptional regulator, partial [Bacillus pumilus]|uniref:TetR/AcrR family transcriptional regulator n=1 Tax=Bacillus pumilus TaxID=1408 RepID=UPI003315A85D